MAVPRLGPTDKRYEVQRRNRPPTSEDRLSRTVRSRPAVAAVVLAVLAITGVGWYRTTRHYEIGQALKAAHHDLDPTIDALGLPVLDRRSTRPTYAGCRPFQMHGNCQQGDDPGKVTVELEPPANLELPNDLPALAAKMQQAGFELLNQRCTPDALHGPSYAALFEVQKGIGISVNVSLWPPELGGLIAYFYAEVDHDTLEPLPARHRRIEGTTVGRAIHFYTPTDPEETNCWTTPSTT